MFCQDMKRHENPIGAFNQNDIRIWSLFEIIAHGLSNWLIIELHFPVTPAFGYGVVKIDTSNYWMFLHPIVGCTSNYWIKSNSWILAQTDDGRNQCGITHAHVHRKDDILRQRWLSINHILCIVYHITCIVHHRSCIIHQKKFSASPPLKNNADKLKT